MWYLDPATYGYPQSQHQLENALQFTRDQSNIGTGTFKLYDETASQLVDVTWFWSNAQLATFRRDWNNPERLSKGANWFQIDLYLGTGTSGIAPTPASIKRYTAHFVGPYAAELTGGLEWRVSANLEVGQFGTT